MNTKLNFKQSIMAGLMAATVAAVINVILFFIFHGVGIITDNILLKPNEPLTFVHALFASILPTIVATIVFFLFEKYSKNGFRNFTILATLLFIVFLANPFMGIKGVPLSYALALEVMHVVVFGAILFFIKRAITAANK